MHLSINLDLTKLKKMIPLQIGHATVLMENFLNYADTSLIECFSIKCYLIRVWERFVKIFE